MTASVAAIPSRNLKQLARSAVFSMRETPLGDMVFECDPRDQATEDLYDISGKLAEAYDGIPMILTGLILKSGEFRATSVKEGEYMDADNFCLFCSAMDIPFFDPYN